MNQSYILRAKLADDKRTYRDIQINSQASLFTLAQTIVAAFDFEFDHMCGFYESLKYYHAGGRAYTMFADHEDTKSESPGELSITKHKVADLWRAPKDTWQFIFDYGDDWRFLVQLVSVSEEAKSKPEVVKSAGEAPEQYPEPEDLDDGIDEPRRMGEAETMMALALVFRHQNKILLLQPDIPGENDFLFPLVPVRHPLLEDSIRHYCETEFGVKPTDWVGIAPFTTQFGEGNVVLCAPYIIDIATDKLKLDKTYRQHKWCTLDELENEMVSGFMSPVLDYLSEEELVNSMPR